MKRFMGMMLSDEIETRKRYKDSNGLSITITAGQKGWTIIYADGGTTYHDNETTTEENFKEAYAKLKSIFPDIVEEVEQSQNCQMIYRD